MPLPIRPLTISPVSVFEMHNYFRIHTECECHLNSHFLSASVQNDSSFEQDGTSKRKPISRPVALKRHIFAPIWTRVTTDPYSLYTLANCGFFDECNNAYCTSYMVVPLALPTWRTCLACSYMPNNQLYNKHSWSCACHDGMCGEWRYSATHYNSGHELSDELYAPAALTLTEDPPPLH